MGMYTELIFGATLKKETPESVINALKFMMGYTEDKPSDFPLPEGRCEWLFESSSYYFGVSTPSNMLIKDDIDGQYVVSTRSNVKNYEREIQTFLGWIKPHIEYGSGVNDMYAIVMYEESEEPDIYYLETENDLK